MNLAAFGGVTAWRAVESLATWAWRASWQGAILAGIVAIVLWIAGRRMSPAWRFALWGLVLVRLAAPVVIVEVKWVASAPPQQVRTDLTQTHAVDVRPRVIPVSSAPPLVAPSIQTVDQPLIARAIRPQRDWTGVRVAAIWTWMVGVIVLGLRVAWSSARLARAVGRMRPIVTPRVIEALRSCCADLGIRRMPEIRELPGAGGPALVGFRWPRILLPAQALEAMSPGELRLILLHELAHVKRRDVLVNWLATAVAVLHWPNPAVWLVLWRMRVERELACDEWVLQAGRDRAGGAIYARTILKLVESLSSAGRPQAVRATGAVGILEGKAQLQRRLQMIARFDSAGRRWPAMAVLVGLTLSVLALCGVGRATGDDKKTAAAQTPPPARGGATTVAPAPGGTIDAAGAGLPDRGAAPPTTAAPSRGSMPSVRGGGGDSRARTGIDDPANARTAEKLKKPISVKFNGQGLADCLDFLRDTTGADILVEWASLESAGITKDNPVTLDLREPIPAGDALSLMFRAMGVGLTWELDRGVVVVHATGDQQVSTTLIMRVYDVSDLIAGGTTAAVVPAGASGGGGGFGGGPAGVGAGNPTDVSQLVTLIVTTVQPETWRDAGGATGSISIFRSKLVIKSTEAVHRDVAQLLEMLREKPAKGAPAKN
ncbi:MAG TPA: M56 family metallopeptidase [Tepidisphaeraceae bacterium]